MKKNIQSTKKNISIDESCLTKCSTGGLMFLVFVCLLGPTSRKEILNLAIVLPRHMSYMFFDKNFCKKAHSFYSCG